MTIKGFSRLAFSLAASGLIIAGLFLLVGVSAQTARANPGDLFVTPSGSGDCSAASPCSLPAALSTAVDGDSLYLAQGIYTNTGGAVVTVTNSLNFYGGWDGRAAAPPVLDPQAYPVTLDGEGERRGVFVGSGITVTIQGLTITNGMHDYQGAGLYAQNAHLTLREVTVCNNTIDVYDIPNTYAYGGGVRVEGGSLFIESSTFRGNSAWAQKFTSGGGLAISGNVTTTITNSLFIDNDAWNASGVYFVGEPSKQTPFFLVYSTFQGNGLGNSPGRAGGGYASALVVAHAFAAVNHDTFTNNYAANDSGAVQVVSSYLQFNSSSLIGNQNGRISGMDLISVDFLIQHSIIAGNQTLYTWLDDIPAICVSGNSDGRFIFSTIANNHSDYGILVSGTSSVEIKDTILVSYTLGISTTAGTFVDMDANLWGSGDWANDTDWAGDGTIFTGTINVWGEPGFIAPHLGNYHIGARSAAIDAGVEHGTTVDIDGHRRPVGAGYDIGADEFLPIIHLPMLLRK